MGNGHSSSRGEKPKKDEREESGRAPAPAPAEDPASSPADSAHVYEKKKTLTAFINLSFLKLGVEEVEDFLLSTGLDTELGNANNKKYSEAIDAYFERQDASGLNQILQECGERTRFFSFIDDRYVLIERGSQVVIDWLHSDYIDTNLKPLPDRPPMSTLEKVLTLNPGIQLVNVPGDGHCFYHAVAHQLNALTPEQFNALDIPAILEELDITDILVELGTPYIPGQPVTGALVHKIAIQYVLTHWYLYPEFMVGPDPVHALNAYIAEHQGTGTWAEGPIIQGLANAINININVAVFNADGVHTNPLNIQPSAGPGAQTVHIANLAQLHFVAHIVPAPMAAAAEDDHAPAAAAVADAAPDTAPEEQVAAVEEITSLAAGAALNSTAPGSESDDGKQPWWYWWL